MTDKFITYMLTNGKNDTWDNIGRQFGMSGDKARKAWKTFETSKAMMIGKGVVDNQYKKLISNEAKPKRWEDYNKDESNYIADLEDIVVKLARENADPKSRLVRSMNVGPNPLDYSLELQKETILAEMRNASPSKSPYARRINPAKENLLELSMFDLHIGKLSWDKEVGEDYDIEIASQRFREAISVLLSRMNTSEIDRILLPIGNDMLNIDGKEGMTTAGTPQDSDSRFGKMFRAAKELIIDAVDHLLGIAPVDIVVVPGNHDELSMFTLGEVLDAWYHRTMEVNVYNSPKLRKYYQYGQNMLMFTHGNREKHADLGMIAATEMPIMWADTKYREVHVGHFHKNKVVQYVTVDEFQGFKVRILPSLSGTDAWHYSKGYMSAKAAKAFVWNKNEGLIAEYTYTV
jgi:hypothetical protein